MGDYLAETEVHAGTVALLLSDHSSRSDMASDRASHAQPTGKISENHHFISVRLFDSRAFELCLPRTALTQEVESREFKETKASAGPDREQSGREEDRAGVVREGKWGRAGTS